MAYINKNERIQGEKLYNQGAKAIFLCYKGNHDYVIWLLEGSRTLRIPYVVFHENTGNLSEIPDSRDIVRSLPQHVQRKLRHRAKFTKGWIKNVNNNIVNKNVTNSDNGMVKRKIGRPKKKKIEFYRHMLEAPEKDSEVLQLLEQKGAIADKEKTAAFAEKFTNFSITRLTLANNFGDFAAL
jgi:hypothetical protein